MFCTLSASGWHNFEQILYIAHAKYICYNNIMAYCISTMQVGTAISQEHAALYSSHLQSLYAVDVTVWFYEQQNPHIDLNEV
jgi:hypothetical protein